MILLPEPFASADMGAHTEHGRREVTWNIAGPGELFRNGYERCWVDIRERDPWKGEPLWLSASRRPAGHESWGRCPFTDKGRQALHDLLVPLVSRYGFSRLWLELHRRKGDSGSLQQMRRAEREAQWWEMRSDLHRMHADGLVEFRPVPETPLGQHPPTSMPVLSGHGRPDYEHPAAEALVDGERVGWMTVRGNLVPDRTILDGAA